MEQPVRRMYHRYINSYNQKHSIVETLTRELIQTLARENFKSEIDSDANKREFQKRNKPKLYLFIYLFIYQSYKHKQAAMQQKQRKK